MRSADFVMLALQLATMVGCAVLFGQIMRHFRQPAAVVTPVNPWSWSEGFGYEQANLVEGATRTLYCAGQTSVDADGNPVHVADVTAQLEMALDNLEAVLAKASMSLGDVVRLNYFTTDLEAFFAGYERIVARLRAAGARPAGTLVQVTRLALPGLMVELEATASQ